MSGRSETVLNKADILGTNVTMKRVHVTLVVVEKQLVLYILCACPQPYLKARNVHAPYNFVIRRLYGSTIFFKII